jgi:hypothetical protein
MVVTTQGEFTVVDSLNKTDVRSAFLPAALAFPEISNQPKYASNRTWPSKQRDDR